MHFSCILAEREHGFCKKLQLNSLDLRVSIVPETLQSVLGLCSNPQGRSGRLSRLLNPPKGPVVSVMPAVACEPAWVSAGTGCSVRDRVQ